VRPDARSPCGDTETDTIWRAPTEVADALDVQGMIPKARSDLSDVGARRHSFS